MIGDERSAEDGRHPTNDGVRPRLRLVIVALDDENLMAVEQMATHHRLDFTPIGRTSSEQRVRIVLQGLPLVDVAVEELVEAFETAIPQALVLG